MVEFAVDVVGDEGKFYATYEVVTHREEFAYTEAVKQAKADGCIEVQKMTAIITEGQRNAS